MERVAELEQEVLWEEFARKTEATRSRSRQLSSYSSVSTKHYPQYLHTLEAGDVSSMQQYQLPAMPQSFLSRVGKASEMNTDCRVRQQLIRERLVPLIPALRQLVWARKQAAERMLRAFFQAQQRVAAGPVLPLTFQYTDAFPWLHQEEQAVEVRQREHTLRFMLWNRREWILRHKERYSTRVIRAASQARGIYSPQRDQFFVQFDGTPQDLLWVGDLIDQRLLQHFQGEPQNDPTYAQRKQCARDLGFPHGCSTGQEGLLRADARWFAEHTRRGDLVFEPEAMYRGVLYGAALAILAMTSGGSTSELLQMSAQRWVETPEGRQQWLLPERGGENARRLFKVSPEARQLLGEIERGLVEAYGEIPVTGPSRQITKFDQLQPERYFFQWQRGMVDPHDTDVLLRFLLYGVNLTTADGKALRFSMEQIRYGGNLTSEERMHALMPLGFHPSILTHLSSTSREVYSRHFYAYFDYAGSKETALRPLTLARWMVHLREKGYEMDTINRMVVSVQQIFAAAASHGTIDPTIASGFQRVEKLHTDKEDPSPTQGDAEPHLSYHSYFKTCGKPYCDKCRDGQGHGPYWYAYGSVNGKACRIYIGRVKNEASCATALRTYEQRQGSHAANKLQAPAPRAAQPDIVVPLVPALCQLAQLRKQLAEHVLLAFHKAQKQVASGEASLPFRFQFAETIPELRTGTLANPGGTIEERVVILDCTLWDKRSWVLHHQDRFSKETISLARRGVNAYSQERNTFFLQFHGRRENLLWFGPLVEHNLFRMLEPHKAQDEESIQRYQSARDLGFPRGCHTTRAGLLDTSDRWFAENARVKEFILEPEAMYRAALYGAALVLLVLSAGMGVGEILQLSADPWVVQQPASGSEPPGPINLQALFPHGAQEEDGRHHYPIGPEAKHLLDEIACELVQVHGEVPVVRPSRHAKQQALLRSERYLFQWQRGMIDPDECTVLLRYILYGLKTPAGELLLLSTEGLSASAPTPALMADLELKRLRDRLLAPLAIQLAPASLLSYRRHVFQYLRFAGSAEQAYQPETLRRWIAHLSQSQPGKRYDPVAIDQKITPVRRSMAEAGRLHLLDRTMAEEFTSIRVQRHPVDRGRKRGPAPKVNETIKRWLIDLWQATPGGLTGEALRSAYILKFGGDISTATLYAALAQLNVRKTPPPALTADDEAWIVEQCTRDPGITARELKEKLATERGKRVPQRKLNRIRANYGVRRPSESLPRVQPQRPASYKLEDEDIAWLLQQRRDHPALSSPKLQAKLREQRGKEIGDHAITVILRKHGLPTAKSRRS